MKTNIMTFDKAYELVKMKRNMINPNNGLFTAYMNIKKLFLKSNQKLTLGCQ
jgi:hypothetical protein